MTNDMTPEQLEAGNDWLESTTCTHDKSECPEHEGNFDCNPFCSTCEGEQEYCQTCHTADLALIAKFADESAKEAWLCPDCTVMTMDRYNPSLTDDYDPETEDGFRAFSKTPCYLCLSPLHGERYRFAQWTNNNKETN